MPEYSKSDIEFIVRYDHIKEMFKAAYQTRNGLRDQALMAILYLTGCRPAELKEMLRDDIQLIDKQVTPSETENYIQFKIERKKRRKGQFQVKKRTLLVRHDSDSFLQLAILKYRSRRPVGEPLFTMTKRNMEYIIEKYSTQALDTCLCPYNFRHSLMTRLAEQNKPAHEIKYVKGATTLSSVESYLHAKPQVIDIDKEGAQIVV